MSETRAIFDTIVELHETANVHVANDLLSKGWILVEVGPADAPRRLYIIGRPRYVAPESPGGWGLPSSSE